MTPARVVLVRRAPRVIPAGDAAAHVGLQDQGGTVRIAAPTVRRIGVRSGPRTVLRERVVLRALQRTRGVPGQKGDGGTGLPELFVNSATPPPYAALNFQPVTIDGQAGFLLQGSLP